MLQEESVGSTPPIILACLGRYQVYQRGGGDQAEHGPHLREALGFASHAAHFF